MTSKDLRGNFVLEKVAANSKIRNVTQPANYQVPINFVPYFTACPKVDYSYVVDDKLKVGFDNLNNHLESLMLIFLFEAFLSQEYGVHFTVDFRVKYESISEKRLPPTGKSNKLEDPTAPPPNYRIFFLFALDLVTDLAPHPKGGKEAWTLFPLKIIDQLLKISQQEEEFAAVAADYKAVFLDLSKNPLEQAPAQDAALEESNPFGDEPLEEYKPVPLEQPSMYVSSTNFQQAAQVSNPFD